MKKKRTISSFRGRARAAILLLAVVSLSSVFQIRADEKPSGKAAADVKWTSLFNGKNTKGWTNAAGKKPGEGWIVENGALCRRAKAGDIWTKKRYGDFVLELEFKTTGNSGVFFRTDNPRNNVQTGIEIQVDNPGGPGKHSVGAIYDLVKPSRNVGKKDWNKLVVTCNQNMISVNLNGEDIAAMDLDKWTEARKNPDGSKNKFKTALKDFKRKGHIGLQEHGSNVCYRNIRIRKLKKGK